MAEWQNIVYGEYLPAVLGGRSMRKHRYDMFPQKNNINYFPLFNLTFQLKKEIIINNKAGNVRAYASLKIYFQG